MKTKIISNSLSNITYSGRVRLLGFLIGCALICSLASVFLLNTNLIRDWENRFQAQFYLWRMYFSEPVASKLPLVLVLIDDHSLPVDSARSPINRSWLADLLQSVSEHKPTLVGMNILLDRPGKEAADQKLRNAIAKAGNVILRTDPFYPVYPEFDKAALDKGTLKFRLDSSDTLQEVCSGEVSCQNPNIFFKKILDYYQFAKGVRLDIIIPDQPWLKINFGITSQNINGFKITNFPVLRAHEVKYLPEDAFEGKIVLIGTGFPDLYPLYRIPLSEPELMLQETEVIAQVLNMIAGDNYLKSLDEFWVGILMFGLMLLVTLVLIFRGFIMGLMTSLVAVMALFAVAGWAFAFHNIELPFVLPTTILMFFTITGILIGSVQERFFRLSAELNLKQAKIDFLTNELHSHHLFNEFSRLSVMIQHDPKSAKEYLVEFAEMLRSSLKYGDQVMVPVGIQIEYLKSYLKQQQMIFQEKMVFNFAKADNIDSLQVPWHTFFPLIENAVKYTEALIKLRSLDKATIEIHLELAKNTLEFTVINPFSPDVQTASSKTGLKNLRERLALAYPNGGYLLDFSHDDHIWKAELRLPIQSGTV